MLKIFEFGFVFTFLHDGLECSEDYKMHDCCFVYDCLFSCVTQEVCIMKASGTLGLSIVGGTDHASHPFGNNEPGVFISKVSYLSLHYYFAFGRPWLIYVYCIYRCTTYCKGVVVS